MSEYILAMDQGTTGSTALIINKNCGLVAKGYREFRQIYPQPGWVEHDLEDIWTSQKEAVKEALAAAKIDGSQIAAIGITNQRETSGIWKKVSGKPVGNAIVWQDRRTAARCAKLVEQGCEKTINEKTGLLLDPYFSGTKLEWRLANDPSLRKQAEDNVVIAGTVDTFLVYRLTGKKAHVTDVSNASRTLLFNLRTLQWDDELLSIFGIPRQMLPEVKSSSEIYGRTEDLDFLPDGIPIAGIAGDQQAALFGQCCFGEGEAKCTYGTGAFMLANTGSRPVLSRKRMLTTVAWQINGTVNYALEGSSFIAGACVQWLRDGLQIINKASEIEALAAQVKDSDGVTLVPAFVGLGAPHWKSDARAIICGISRGTTKAHIARAALDGIALQIVDLAKGMEDDMGGRIGELKVDGGAAVNNLLMQLQADLLNAKVVRPKMVETTGLGAAFLAGLAVKFWDSQEEIKKSWNIDRQFTPSMDEKEREAMLRRWNAAVAKA